MTCETAGRGEGKRVSTQRRWRWPFLLLAASFPGFFLAACAGFAPAPQGGPVVPLSALPGWSNDRHAQAWPALLQSCVRLAPRYGQWRNLCRDAELLGDPDDETARAFLETRFQARAAADDDNGNDGLITGYYEPVLNGSPVRTERYRYPLYKRPDDLLVVDLGELYPELRGRPVRGRLDGDRRVVPYLTREQINNGGRHLAGQELAWVDDPVALFFLHIQGSGRVRLPDETILAIGYVDQNGHPYLAIGRELVARGVMALEEVNLDSIRAWLEANPGEAEEVLNSNPSYIFFSVRDPRLPGPLGSLNVPLTPQRSIAVDPSYIPLGMPIWLDSTLPGPNGGAENVYQRLVLAQDTGGAIRGMVRADLFFGGGEEAEALAGRMKQRGRLYVLYPVPRF